MAYNVYSLPDCKSVLYHPDVGTANLHQCGMGKIVVSAAGDLTSHTTTADGYIVVNKLKTTNGTITLEVPQNSIGDDFLRRWARWARSTASPNRIALGTLTIYDAVAGFTVVCTGVSLQKVPDRTFDRTGTNLTYTLLATTIRSNSETALLAQRGFGGPHEVPVLLLHYLIRRYWIMCQ